MQNWMQIQPRDVNLKMFPAAPQQDYLLLCSATPQSDQQVIDELQASDLYSLDLFPAALQPDQPLLFPAALQPD